MSGPKHSKSRSFRNLFGEVASFTELERRISALPTNQDRGDAFEVFAEAYLATQTACQASNVWPFDRIPAELRQKHGLDTDRDMGADGVYETTLGELNAYQVKFRTGRPSLTWEELSTFMGLTEQVAERVLFTNSDDLPSLMGVRKGFFCIRGSDLDRLERRDFEAIVGWLESGAVVYEHKNPREHQAQAIAAITTALQADDRVVNAD